MFLVEILFGDEFGFVKLCGAVNVELGAIELRLGAIHGGLRGSDGVLHRSHSRFGGRGVRQCSVDGGLLRHHVRAGLDGFQSGDGLALADMVALLHQDLRDGRRAKGVRPQVDVILGFNFAGGGDGSGQVLARGFSSLDVDDSPFVKTDAGKHTAADQNDQRDDQYDLPFTLHSDSSPQQL